MKSLPWTFFMFGALTVLAGMIWGIQMSASQNHLMAAAHAHLNLIGFVISAIYGTFYALVPKAGESGIAKVHLLVHIVAVLTIVPGIVMALSGSGELLAKLGSVITLISMLIFIWVLIRFRQGDN